MYFKRGTYIVNLYDDRVKITDLGSIISSNQLSKTHVSFHLSISHLIRYLNTQNGITCKSCNCKKEWGAECGWQKKNQASLKPK